MADQAGSDWWFSKILRIRTGLDSILSDWDWTRTEKFVSPLISAGYLPSGLRQSSHPAGILSGISLDPFYLLQAIEMTRAANSPVFGPSATVLKQSASNFFCDDVIPVRYGPLQFARQNFLFFAKFHNLTNNIFCCCSLHFTVLPTFRFTCFHANQWTMLGINQSNQHFHL